MKIESVSIESLTPDPANTRAHPDRNINTVKASLTRFGQQKPIVVDGKGVVVAGNATLEAAKRLEWSSIDVVRTGLEGTDKAAFGIADNRTAELAEWNTEALDKLIGSMDLDDIGDAIGFTDDDVRAIVSIGAPEFKEYDETAADSVKLRTCPKCGAEFPV